MLTPDQLISPNDLILRDTLAIERTELANERTFYAAIRTALTFFIAGVTVIKFMTQPFLIFFGWSFLVVSVIFALTGFLKKISNSKNIHASYYFTTQEVQASFQKNSIFSINVKSDNKSQG